MGPAEQARLVACGVADREFQIKKWLQLERSKHPLKQLSQQLEKLRTEGQTAHELHLVGHGHSNGIELSGQWIDQTSLVRASAELAKWQVSSIVLWCCNVGQNKEFIALLEELTGAEVFTTSDVINKNNLVVTSRQGSARLFSDVLNQETINQWEGELAATQRGIDIDGEAQGDRSGWSVSLSADGNTVAIGARQNDGGGNRSGSTRIYNWDGTTWSQLGGDIDGEAADDESGYSVSLSSDGTTVAIGARNNDGNGNNAGQTRVFSWNGTTWNQLGGDIDGEAADDESGYSVSLSGNGSTVAIGARKNDGNGNSSGQTRIYSWNGTAWSQLGNDIDGEAANDFSGSSVSLSEDGRTVAIGARKNDGNGSNSGQARIYSWNGTTWSQLGTDIDGEATDDESGWSVSLAGNGTVIAVSAHQNDGNGGNAGQTRI